MSKYSQYEKVSNVKQYEAASPAVSKYDAYAKVPDGVKLDGVKPQANYHILPSAQKLYEAAFAATASTSASTSTTSTTAPPLGAPPPVPGRPPALSAPPVPGAVTAGVGGGAAGGGLAAAASPATAAKNKKQCQRCEVNKATAKVTIEDLAVKLCDACANAVQTQPAAAREALARARGASGAAAAANANAAASPPGPCEICRQRPQHVRTVGADGAAVTVCAVCMSQQNFFKSLSTYAVSCVANKNLPEAQSSFEELLMLSPEHPTTLYNCACVEALLQQPERSLRLLERALKAGYNNFENLKNDKDLNKVRKLSEYKAMLERYQPQKKGGGLFKRTSTRDLEAAAAAPPSPSIAQRDRSMSTPPNADAPPPVMQRPVGNSTYVSSSAAMAAPGGASYNSTNGLTPATSNYKGVTYHQLAPDALQPPTDATSPRPSGLGGPPPVPNKAASGPVSVPGRGPAVGGKPPAIEYRSVSDIGKSEVKYESSFDAVARGAAGGGGVVYDAKFDGNDAAPPPAAPPKPAPLNASFASAASAPAAAAAASAAAAAAVNTSTYDDIDTKAIEDDLKALDDILATSQTIDVDSDSDDPPPPDGEEPVAAKAAPPVVKPRASVPVPGPARGPLPQPTAQRGSPPTPGAARGPQPGAPVAARSRGPLPTPGGAARGAAIAKPRGSLPTPGRGPAPAVAAATVLPSQVGDIVLEPLSDSE